MYRKPNFSLIISFLLLISTLGFGCGKVSPNMGDDSYTCSCNCFCSGPAGDSRLPSPGYPIYACADNNREAELACGAACEQASRSQSPFACPSRASLDCNGYPEFLREDRCALDEDLGVSNQEPLIAYFHLKSYDRSNEIDWNNLVGVFNEKKSYMILEKDVYKSNAKPANGKLSMHIGQCKYLNPADNTSNSISAIRNLKASQAIHPSKLSVNASKLMALDSRNKLSGTIESKKLRTCDITIQYVSALSKDISLKHDNRVGYTFRQVYNRNHGLWHGRTIHFDQRKHRNDSETIDGIFEIYPTPHLSYRAFLSADTSPTGSILLLANVAKARESISGIFRIGPEIPFDKFLISFVTKYRMRDHKVKGRVRIVYDLLPSSESKKWRHMLKTDYDVNPHDFITPSDQPERPDNIPGTIDQNTGSSTND